MTDYNVTPDELKMLARFQSEEAPQDRHSPFRQAFVFSVAGSARGQNDAQRIGLHFACNCWHCAHYALLGR